MKTWIKSAAAGALAAAGIGLGAWALEGTYVTSQGVKITFAAATAHVVLPDGTALDFPIKIEGDKLTFEDAPAAAGGCPAGTYTVAESGGQATLTLVSDGCDQRKADLTAAPLKKAE